MVRKLISTNLVGRRRELARLDEGLQRAMAGEPSAVLLAGDAGVGKTRLVSEFVKHAEQDKVQVLIGGCIELGEGSLPYAPFVEALRGLAQRLPPGRLAALAGPGRAELARLLPELGATDTAGDSAQLQLFEHVLGLLRRLSEQSPVVLVLEDLHWSDRSTRDLLAFLAHSMREGRIMLLGTFRSDELSRQHPLRPLLARFERDPQIVRLNLPALDRIEIAELITELICEVPDTHLVEQVFTRSEGNPFFAEELVAAALDGGAENLPQTLREVLLTRVEGLPPDVQTVLRVAAAAGREVDHELLAAVAGLDQPRLLAALRLAVAEQVLLSQPGTLGYRFRHALVAEAIHDDLLPGERTALHAELARVLEERPELAGRAGVQAALAWHWYAAHNHTWALVSSIQAAKVAEDAFAHADAQRHLERALELWDSVPDAEERTGTDLIEILKYAASTAIRAADTVRGIALARKALSLIDPATDATRAGLLHMMLANALRTSGREGSDEEYEEAVRLVPADPPSAARARVLGAYGTALMLRPRWSEARRLCEEAVAVARGVGSVKDETHALVSLAVALDGLGEIEASAHAYARARELAEQSGNIDQLLRVHTNLSNDMAVNGDLEGGVAMALQGAEIAKRKGLGRAQGAFLLCNAAEFLLELGRWDEAEPLIREALALESANTAGLHAVILQSTLDLRRGALEDAARGIKEAGNHLAAVRESQFLHLVATLRAELAVREGRHDDARAHVAEGLDLLAEPEGRRLFGGPLYVIGVRAEADRWEAGADGAVRSVAEGLIGRLRRELEHPRGATPEFRAAAQLAQAEWSRFDGDGGDPGSWDAASAAYEAADRPYPAAYARYRGAAALLARGERARAAEYLRRAMDVATRLRAVPLSEATERLARRGRVELHEVAETDHALGLTPREIEVLRLLAEGRSNRQIGEALYISGKTASVHVSNILAKLGVDGRGEAAAVAYRLGLVETS